MKYVMKYAKQKLMEDLNCKILKSHFSKSATINSFVKYHTRNIHTYSIPFKLVMEHVLLKK